MKCTEARFLITMHRPGERTTGQDVFLSEHLDICPECSAWKAEYDEAVSEMRADAGKDPVIPRPEELVDTIVGQTIRLRRQRPQPTLFDRILEPGSRPAVRRVLLGSVSLVIMFFALQASSLLSGIHSMERSLSYRHQRSMLSSLRVESGLNMLLSPDTRQAITKALGISKIEETFSALSTGERAEIRELAKRFRDKPLQAMTRQQWKDYLKSAAKTGQM